jgi:predicted DCC family thiol-disulfide oxidoreductase YuxK
MSEPTPAQHAIVLFDGDCAFCNASVVWIIRRNPSDTLRFAPLESPEGKRALGSRAVADTRNTMVLIDAAGVHTSSTASLRIASHLTQPWALLGACGLVIPRPIRDAVYRLIARNRHRIYGAAVCEVPTPELRRRMLADVPRAG